MRILKRSLLAATLLVGLLAPLNAPALAAQTEETNGGEFVPLEPTRIVDTRSGLGAPAAPLGKGTAMTFQVAGRGGVPADAVHAVVLNVTVVGVGSPGYAVVYPCCWKPPTASSHNFGPHEVAPNQVVTAVGPKGRARVYVSAPAHVLVDVAGYYTDYDSDIVGARLRPTPPTRILDTREGRGAPRAKVGKHGEITLGVSTTQAVPASATAVVMNVTATNPTDSTFVTVYPDGVKRPVASNLNLVAGETRPNLVTVKLGDKGAVRLYNHSGSVDLIADVVGYYENDANRASTDGRVVAFHPYRILDTRSSGVPVGAGATVSVNAGMLLPIIGEVPSGAIINVTATQPTSETFATLYPKHLPHRPNASTLNASAGQTIPNLSLVSISNGGTLTGFTLYNHQGSSHLIADIVAIVL